MQPINVIERKKAYTYFLLFFIITVVLISVAAFFGMKVPFKQNEKLQDKISMLQNEKTFSEIFQEKMADTKGILDTVNKAGVQAELLDQKITDRLKALSALVDKDTTINKKLYMGMVQSLNDLQEAKKGIRSFSNQNVNLAQYMQQVEGLKSDLARANAERDGLRTQMMILSQNK